MSTDTTAAEPSTQEAKAGASKRGVARLVLEKFGLVGVLIVMIIVFSIALPHTFPTSTNLRITLSAQSVTLMLALAVTLPLRAGDFDLSLSMIMVGSASVIAELTTKHHMGLFPAIIIALLGAILIGAVNAILIVGVGVDSFIATLGMMTFLGGAISGYTGGLAITGLPHGLRTIADSDWLSLPSMVFIAWIFAVVLWYVYEYTPFGRRLLFTGGNRDAAKLAGIKVGQVRAAAFIGAAVISALAGILLAGGLGAVDPTSGGAYLLSPYAAAFLGMTVIQFRRFNVIGTVVGCYLLAVGVSGLQLFGVASWVSDVFNGLMLVAAVTAATLLRRTWSLASLRRVFGRVRSTTPAEPTS
jgi:ribose transport system permease protein